MNASVRDNATDERRISGKARSLKLGVQQTEDTLMATGMLHAARFRVLFIPTPGVFQFLTETQTTEHRYRFIIAIPSLYNNLQTKKWKETILIYHNF